MNLRRLLFFTIIFTSACQPRHEVESEYIDTISDTVTTKTIVDTASEPFPENSMFVIVSDLDPTIVTSIKYATNDNFIGKPLDGYFQPIAILTRPAATALIEVNKELQRRGLALKIFDAYRPQRAVEQIIRWSHDSDDTLMRQKFYPRLKKVDLRYQGYISKRSKHAMGSTVDLTIIDTATHQELDMGTPFDFLDVKAHYNADGLSKQQRDNRKLLRTVMSRHGFYPIEAEWWHFTLRHQPYNTAFDFPVHADSVRYFSI